MKLNPTNQKRPQRKFSGPKTFTDPLQPGDEIVIELQSLGTPELALVSEDAHSLVIAINGSEEDGIAPTQDPVMLEGRPIPMSMMLATQALMLERMQVQQPADRYRFEEFIQFSETMPNAWRQMTRTAFALNGTAPKKDSTALPELSSDFASNSLDNIPS